MKKVLIIEDSTTVTKILKHILKSHSDIIAIFADTFAQSQTLYQQHKTELFAAIIDLNLPDAPNGETVDFFLSKKIPSIVLTANYQDDKREELLNKGITDYVIKENRYSYNYALNLIHRLDKNQHIKVLVAEDSKPTRSFIKNILQKHLYQVIETSNGIEALEALQQNPDIKLLITDYNMPEMNGFELIRTIRQNVDKSDIIIIGLSGEGKGTLSAKFIKNGANDFLQKPFYHEELYCRVMHNIEELELIEEIKSAANHDFLTKLYNRRYFFNHGYQLYKTANKNKTPLAIAIVSIDYFRKLNDIYGHTAGDEILVFFARELEHTFSRFVIARAGGEKFYLMFPGLNNEQAFIFLDKFRELLTNMTVDVDDDDIHLTFSAGITNQQHNNLDQQVNHASHLLSRAKDAGGNMVICDEDE
jgi:diguanylate cyclase (GGDEF)-like protein